MKNCCILYNTIALYRVYSVACSKQRKFNFKQKAPLFALSLSRSTKVFIVWKRVERKDTSKMCIINASQKKGVSVCVWRGKEPNVNRGVLNLHSRGKQQASEWYFLEHAKVCPTCLCADVAIWIWQNFTAWSNATSSSTYRKQSARKTRLKQH